MPKMMELYIIFFIIIDGECNPLIHEELAYLVEFVQRRAREIHHKQTSIGSLYQTFHPKCWMLMRGLYILAPKRLVLKLKLLTPRRGFGIINN